MRQLFWVTVLTWAATILLVAEATARIIGE
jgi:hypothetical protein